MDTERMIRNLEKVEEDHKNDKVFTGQLNIADMVRDVRKRLEELKPYEDTDLTPQQIKDMQFCLREKSRECAELRMELQKLKNKKNDGWIPVEERLPEVSRKIEEDADCPEYNVTIQGAEKSTTLKYSPADSTWFDDSGFIYPVVAWQPLPETYRPESK